MMVNFLGLVMFLMGPFLASWFTIKSPPLWVALRCDFQQRRWAIWWFLKTGNRLKWMVDYYKRFIMIWGCPKSLRNTHNGWQMIKNSLLTNHSWRSCWENSYGADQDHDQHPTVSEESLTSWWFSRALIVFRASSTRNLRPHWSRSISWGTLQISRQLSVAIPRFWEWTASCLVTISLQMVAVPATLTFLNAATDNLYGLFWHRKNIRVHHSTIQLFGENNR